MIKYGFIALALVSCSGQGPAEPGQQTEPILTEPEKNVQPARAEKLSPGTATTLQAYLMIAEGYGYACNTTYMNGAGDAGPDTRVDCTYTSATNPNDQPEQISALFRDGKRWAKDPSFSKFQ